MADLPDFYRGDTKVYTVTFTDKNGAAIDVSGDELWFTLKVDKGDADPGVLQKVHTFPADASSQAGTGVFRIESSDTSGLVPGQYYYDFQRVIPGTNPLETYTLAEGKVKLLEDVTQDNNSQA